MDESSHVALQQVLDLYLVADLACPWSRIVWHRLLELKRQMPLALHWQPFLLNPHLPPQGIPRRNYLERRFGGGPAATNLFRYVALAGSSDGLKFHFEQIDRQPDTAIAHAALLAGVELGLLEPLAILLFRAFFEMGVDLGDASALSSLLTSAGYPSSVMERARSPAAIDAIRRAHRETVTHGIDGVPTLYVPKIGTIGGAHPLPVLRAFLEVGLLGLGSDDETDQGRHGS